MRHSLFSLSWRVIVRKRTTFGCSYSRATLSFCCIHFFPFFIFCTHTNTLIKKSLFACDVVFCDTTSLFLCAWDTCCNWSLALYLCIPGITGLSSNAVLKSIFNSIQTRVMHLKMKTVSSTTSHIEHIDGATGVRDKKRSFTLMHLMFEPFCTCNPTLLWSVTSASAWAQGITAT